MAWKTTLRARAAWENMLAMFFFVALFAALPLDAAEDFPRRPPLLLFFVPLPLVFLFFLFFFLEPEERGTVS